MLTQTQIDQIKLEAEGKSVNVFLPGGICISGSLTDVSAGFIKVELAGSVNYFALSTVQAIQISA
jgi:hypothetical protein